MFQLNLTRVHAAYQAVFWVRRGRIFRPVLRSASKRHHLSTIPVTEGPHSELWILCFAGTRLGTDFTLCYA